MPATEARPDDPEEPGDEACMRALQAGDDASLAPLMKRWELPVKAFIARLGVPAADVEDVAQEAFVRLYQQRARFRADAAFKPWLLTIAGNLARNRLRWRGRHATESLDARAEAGDGDWNASADLPATGAPNAANATSAASKAALDAAGDALDAQQLAGAVRAAVERLPAPLREAVVCVELEDLSYQEAASVMACSPKAIETRLYRARELLRKWLAGAWREAGAK